MPASPPATTIPEAWLVIRPRETVRRLRNVLVGVGVLGMVPLLGQLTGQVSPQLGLSAAFVFLYLCAAAIAGSFDRFRIGALNRDSEAATARLAVGDVAGAKAGLVALLPRSRRLGAFHSTYVGLVGVCLYLEGDASAGLAVTDRALASGYLELKAAAPLRDNLRSWRIAMLLSLGDQVEAEAELTRGPVQPTTRLAVEACGERWQRVIDLARASIDDAATRPEQRSTLAMLGAHAARQLDDASVASFEAVLASAPPSALARLTPVYQRFLGEDAKGGSVG